MPSNLLIIHTQEEPFGEPVPQSGKSSGFLTIDFRDGVSAAEKLALLEAWKAFALVRSSEDINAALDARTFGLSSLHRCTTSPG